MNDMELLVAAAKAAGVTHPEVLRKHIEGGWNPLTDDGDALRLAVKLRIDIAFTDDATDVYAHGQGMPWLADKDARRAIVRAAAEIGKQSNAALRRGAGTDTNCDGVDPSP